MAKNPTQIDRLRIATTCPISWEQMTGDNRVRFCNHCQLNVYNISELSRTEAESLISSTEGRLCARLFQRADGTVLTKDCPVGLRALRMRASKRVAAVFAALVSLSAVAFGQHSSAKKGNTACIPQTKITRTKATSDVDEKILSGTLRDPVGATIRGAKVKFENAEARQIRETSTNDEGRFEFDPLAEGTYSIAIEAAGFKLLQLRQVIVEKDKVTSLDVRLEPDDGTATVGILVDRSLIDTPPGTTIFDGKMLQRLPHQQ